MERGYVGGRFFRRARRRGYTAGGTPAATAEIGRCWREELAAFIPGSP
jgi:hypothetical protein